MSNKLFIFFVLVLVSFSSHGTSYTGTIKSLVCHDSETTNICQIQLNGSAPVLDCAKQAWRYTFNGTNAEGKNILSILLAAQVGRLQVIVGGKGLCSLSGSSEDIRHVYINTSE